MPQLLNTSDKLAALRTEMKQAGIDGYLIPRADEYLGEFVAPYAERLQYITGFTGSAGLALVLEDKALALTDARYTLQIAGQVNSAYFLTGDYIQKPAPEWIMEHAGGGATIGYDPHLHTAAQIKSWGEKLQKADITLMPIMDNLIDQIWSDQPPRPQAPVALFPEEFAGLSVEDKIETICDIMEQDTGFVVLTAPDSICWLLNVRGADTEYIPQVLSTAIIDLGDRKIDWFIEPAKTAPEIERALGRFVRFHDPSQLQATLDALEGPVYLDSARSPIWYQTVLQQNKEVTLQDHKDPCILPKSQKTGAEQEALKNAHIADGIALIAFLMWLEKKTKGEHDLTEYSAAEKLESFRAEHPAFKGGSFPTIAGFGPNGAIVHYRPTEEKHSAIGKNNLLLIDSGGQYCGEDFAGTTDITRTVSIGKPSKAMQKHFTLVLKGHIALATAKFPLGTTGAQIDTYARRPLWAHNLDFAHGTGHGVGCYLWVHEEAANISMRGKEALQPGMLLSNEPGYYEEGAYGIRIENLVLVTEEGTNTMTGTPMLGFETVSLVPIDTALVDKALLNSEEKDWLNGYHKQVYKTLSPFLEADEKAWLKKKTKAI